MRLTDLQIRKLRAPELGQKTYFDDALPGFGLRISQGGTKSFVVMYGNRRRLKTLGRYPEIGLAGARLAAKRVQGDLSLLRPGSPSPSPTISFRSARERFLEDCVSRTKASTREEYRRLLHRYFPFEKKLAEITRADIVNAIDELKHAPSERHHAFVAIRTMINWCLRHGFIEASPVPPLKFQSQPRARVLSDDELQTVWRRAEAVGYPYGRIVQLLILTGQRRGEIAGLRRSWIEGDEIIFPQGFTKNKREHRTPVGSLAQGLIEMLPEESDLIFPARGSSDRPYNGWSKSKREFDRTINVADYTLHDLRRTYSSNMARIGVPIHVTEKLLNHISGTVSGVAAVYNRYTYADEMRQAVSKYEAHLVKLIGE